ncbi:MAG: DNA-3-methyladenine glycosylase [Acidobacteriota bacterium]
MATLGPRFFARNTLEVARDLLGCRLELGGCAGVIVETEAYRDDAASHWVTRPNTARIMGESHGLVYIYSIYGMHRCLNFTSDAERPGAVLLRALEPVSGLDLMRERRGVKDDRALLSGPGKLVQALAVPDDAQAQPVTEVFRLERPRRRPSIVTGPRIGISKATELPWRFGIAGSRWLSRPFPKTTG